MKNPSCGLFCSNTQSNFKRDIFCEIELNNIVDVPRQTNYCNCIFSRTKNDLGGTGKVNIKDRNMATKELLKLTAVLNQGRDLFATDRDAFLI